jgi:DNA-binding transcriptional regulator YiaG
MTRLIDYRYDESGLDNVVLKALPVCTDDDGDEVITIPNVNLLHTTLLVEVATKDGGLLPKEIRFLRTEMGLTQGQLGELVGRDAQSVGRWERGETPIEKAHEMIVRAAALEHTEQEVASMMELAQRTVPTAVSKPYLIDASDPNHYRPMEPAEAA